MKPRAWWHLWRWKKILKDIMHANYHVSLSDGHSKESGVVPLRVWRSPVLSSLSQSCHWSLGLVPVQWPGWLKGWRGREGAPWAPIRHHQAEQSSALMRTAERYNGLRRIAPEPRAPMPATKISRAAREEPEIPLRSKEQTLHSAVLSPKFLTSHHKSKANSEFFPYLHYYWLSTGEAI